MRAPLARLLKLRATLEESSRMELERRTALAARVDQARERERAAIRESREGALKAICEEEFAKQAQRRTTEWSNAETAAWRDQQLEPLARATARAVDQGRVEFFERRKERQQVESVLEAERARLQTEQDRRAQRDLDDWFGMKQIREGRKGEGRKGRS